MSNDFWGMPKAERIERMMRGEVLEYAMGETSIYDPYHEEGPFLYRQTTGLVETLTGAWSIPCRVKSEPPAPKMRPCNRVEYLDIVTRPGVVIGWVVDGRYEWEPPQFYTADTDCNYTDMRYAEIMHDAVGKPYIGPERKFEVEE
jgi:hypothetical protein